MGEPVDLDATEVALRDLLARFRDPLVDNTIYGMDSLSWPGAKKQDYFAALKRNKAAVSLYLLPVDRHPDLLTAAPESLRRAHTGKVTFSFAAWNDALASDLCRFLEALFVRYRDEHRS